MAECLEDRGVCESFTKEQIGEGRRNVTETVTRLQVTKYLEMTEN